MPENDLGPKPGESAAQFKDRITQTQRDLARAQAHAPVAVQDPPATQAQLPTATANANPSGAPAATPDQGRMPFVTKEAEDWWSKKGFKSADDMAQSYRELERELHRRAIETRTPPAGQPPAAPPAGMPSWQMYPPTPMTPPPGYNPGWAPPAAPPSAPPAVNVEQLARQYGLDPADFERVSALANDLADSRIQHHLNRVLPPVFNRVASMDKEVRRQNDLVNLMADPAFKNPQVQYEMHRVLEENPAIFDQQHLPVRYAYNEALMRIARANIGGSTTPAVPPAPAGRPDAANNRPPSTAGGNGSGGGGAPSGAPTEITPENFAGMNLQDKRAHLRSLGAFR